jgi:antitoxin ChpS
MVEAGRVIGEEMLKLRPQRDNLWQPDRHGIFFVGVIHLFNNEARRCVMATVALRALGGSVVMAVPKQILSMLHLGVGSQVDVCVEDGRLVVVPKVKPRYTLAELLARCSDENMTLTTEDREWLDAKLVGKEIL